MFIALVGLGPRSGRLTWYGLKLALLRKFPHPRRLRRNEIQRVDVKTTGLKVITCIGAFTGGP